MKRFTGALFPLALLAILAGLTLWLAKAVELPPLDSGGRFRHDPDYEVSNFTVRKSDETGTLRYTLTAKTLVHYPDTEGSDVQQPKVVFLKPGQPPVSLAADWAKLNSDASVVKLYRNVTLVRAATADRETLVGTAPDLTILPDAETAHTDSPVQLVQGQSWLKGKGLDVDNATMTYTLRSRVTGEFQPHKQ